MGHKGIIINLINLKDFIGSLVVMLYFLACKHYYIEESLIPRQEHTPSY